MEMSDKKEIIEYEKTIEYEKGLSEYKKENWDY